MCLRILLIFTGRISSSPLRWLCVVLCLPYATAVWPKTCFLKALHKKRTGSGKEGNPSEGCSESSRIAVGVESFPLHEFCSSSSGRGDRKREVV